MQIEGTHMRLRGRATGCKAGGSLTSAMLTGVELWLEMSSTAVMCDLGRSTHIKRECCLAAGDK